MCNNFISFPGINDPSNDLEKFVEMDVDTITTSTTTIATTRYNDMSEPMYQITMADTTATLTPTTPVAAAQQLQTGNTTTGNTRRHTIGPGDVIHEQALANPTVPINFKFGPENGPHLPINLPMLQNQPLHNFTIKNQHLLKPPTVMEASKYLLLFIFIFTKKNNFLPRHRLIRTQSFRWRSQFTYLLSNNRWGRNNRRECIQ